MEEKKLWLIMAVLLFVAGFIPFWEAANLPQTCYAPSLPQLVLYIFPGVLAIACWAGVIGALICWRVPEDEECGGPSQLIKSSEFFEWIPDRSEFLSE